MPERQREWALRYAACRVALGDGTAPSELFERGTWLYLDWGDRLDPEAAARR
jgi:hypothetical protein